MEEGLLVKLCLSNKGGSKKKEKKKNQVKN